MSYEQFVPAMFHGGSAKEPSDLGFMTPEEFETTVANWEESAPALAAHVRGLEASSLEITVADKLHALLVGAGIEPRSSFEACADLDLVDRVRRLATARDAADKQWRAALEAQSEPDKTS